jgi:hypothetical protein
MIKNHTRRTFFKKCISLSSALALYGCGGGGDETSSLPDDAGTVAPSINSQPQDTIAVEGGSVEFNVIVDSDTPVSYQWRRNGVDINGAINSTYATLQVSLDENGDLYSVVITNTSGSIASDVAELTVLPKGITVDSTSLTVDSTAINVT